MLSSTDDLLEICPGNRDLMESGTYQTALGEFVATKGEVGSRPSSNAAIRSLHTRTQTAGTNAGDLSDEEWLREVMPTETAVLLAGIQADYDRHGVERDPNLQITLLDALEPVKVYADNGLALRRELARHLLEQRRINVRVR